MRAQNVSSAHGVPACTKEVIGFRYSKPLPAGSPNHGAVESADTARQASRVRYSCFVEVTGDFPVVRSDLRGGIMRTVGSCT